MRSRLAVFNWAIPAGLVLLAVVLLVHRGAFSPAGYIVFQDPQAPWIMAPKPVTGLIQQWGHEHVPVTRFSTTFSVTVPPASATLRLRAMGEFRVLLNDKPLSIKVPSPYNWKKRASAEVATSVRPGSNTLDVLVQNNRGPALLSLRLDATGLHVRTGEDWAVQIDRESPGHSIIATDTRPLPDAREGERTVEALANKAPALLLLFLASVIAFFLLRSRFDPARPATLPQLFLAGVAAAWIVLFLTKFALISLDTGFDAWGHLDYVKFIYYNGRLPSPTESRMAYHPPLFYVLAWTIIKIQGSMGTWARDVPIVKVIPFLSGIGAVWVTMRLCRQLFPRDKIISLYAIGFAGFLPLNMYMSAYFSNEGLHAFLFGCCLLVTLDILLDEKIRVSKLLLLSALLGLAALTKWTAAIIVVLAGISVLIKLVTTYRWNSLKLLKSFAALVLPMVLISGWYYARNLAEFGQPFAASWGSGLSESAPDSWWSYPGFHTPGYYLSFGASLVQPYFSCFLSFWDALYSSLWGDGFLAGFVRIVDRHPYWNYQYMAALYLLALPATLLLLAGWVRAGLLAFREAEPARRAAFGLLVILPCAFLFLTIYISLEMPFYGIHKASYSLGALPALALFFALGVQGFDRWMLNHSWLIPRAFFFGWLGTFLATCYLSFAA